MHKARKRRFISLFRFSEKQYLTFIKYDLCNADAAILRVSFLVYESP